MYKRIQWVATAVLIFVSPAVLALGLGGAVVESYLDQPLDVRVELISQSSGELQSITAGLASVDDFALLVESGELNSTECLRGSKREVWPVKLTMAVSPLMDIAVNASKPLSSRP